MTLEVVIPGYRMHTQMFNNVLDGMEEEDAKRRIDNKTNHAIWMVGNLVNCRYGLANVLGLPHKDPHDDCLKMPKRWMQAQLILRWPN